MTFWAERFNEDEDEIWQELRQMLLNQPSEEEIFLKKKQEQAWIDSILNKAFPGVNEMASSRDYKLESELKKGVNEGASSYDSKLGSKVKKLNEMAGSRDYKLESKVKKEPYLTYEDLLDSVKDKKQILQNNNLEKELKPYADIESRADLNEAEKVQKRLEITKIQDLANAREKEITKEHNKEILKDVGGAAISMASAAVPQIGGAKLVGAISQKIAPIVGRKIANEIATGSLKGLSSGMVEGLGRGLLEDKNLLKTMAADGALGAIFGTIGGAVSGKIAHNKRKLNLEELQDKRKDWGIAFTKQSGNPEKAIEKLLEQKQGFVPKAVNKKGIGDIDFVWGDSGKGLKHIIERRNSEGVDGSQFVKGLPQFFRNSKVYDKKEHLDRKYIGDNQKEAAIKKDYDKKTRNWLVSSYNLKEKAPLRDLPGGRALEQTYANGQQISPLDSTKVPPSIIPPSQPNLNPVTQQLNPIEKMVEELRRKRKNRGW